MMIRSSLVLLAGLLSGLAGWAGPANADGPMRFHLVSGGSACGDCRWIMAEGEIESITPALFTRFIHERGLAGSGMVVRLDSPGGDLVGGLRLGREFRRLGLATEVGRSVRNPATSGYVTGVGECESACAYAFLGGTERYVEEGRLGLHRHRPSGSESTPGKPIAEAPIDASIQAMIETYALDMGVNMDLIGLSLRVPAWSMHYLTREELVVYAVVTPERLEQGSLIAISQGTEKQAPPTRR